MHSDHVQHLTHRRVSSLSEAGSPHLHVQSVTHRRPRHIRRRLHLGLLGRACPDFDAYSPMISTSFTSTDSDTSLDQPISSTGFRISMASSRLPAARELI